MTSAATALHPETGLRYEPLARLAIVATVVSWGLGAPLVKLTSIDGLSFSFYRLWLGSALMLTILLVSRRAFTRVLVRQALPGGLLFGVNVAFYFSAINITSVANANLISALQPAIVLLVAGRWFGETVSLRDIALTAIAIGGVGIVVVGSAGAPAWSPKGDLLATGAVILFTGYFLVSKRVRGSGDLGALEYITAIQIISALVVTPITLASGGPQMPAGEDWLWLGIITVITGSGAHLLLNWAHRYVDVTLSSLMVLAVPVVAGPAAWVILDEALSPLQIIGGMVTLGAMAAVVLRRPVAAAAPGTPAAETLGAAAGSTLTKEHVR